MELNRKESVVDKPVVFVDTSTFINIYSEDVEFNYLLENNLSNNLSFSPSLFLEYIGFSGNYRKNFLKKYTIEKPNSGNVTQILLSIYDQYYKSLKQDENYIINSIKNKLQCKKKFLKDKTSRFVHTYLSAFDRVLELPNFIEGIIDFMCLAITSSFKVNFGNPQSDDEIYWLKNLVLFCAEINKLQYKKSIEVHPFSLMISQTNLFLDAFDKHKDSDTLPDEIRLIFGEIKKSRNTLIPIKLRREKETADMDLIWFSYSGYFWEGKIRRVISCTHDKRLCKEFLVWRELFIRILNNFSKVRFRNGKIKLFDEDMIFLRDYSSF